MERNPSLALVKPKNAVKKHLDFTYLKQEILDLLQEVPNLESLKRDPEFVLYVCNLVENKQSKHKIDKKELVKDVFKSLFCELNNDQDLKRMDDHIEFLCSNKMIKKLPVMKKMFKQFCAWAIKKL